MPYIDLPAPNGTCSFHYSISTPTSNSAEKITPNLPCIIFLHSGYLGKEIFELQFCDRNLRRFNLITFDMRGYGDTLALIGEARYTPTESAHDVHQIMAALNLPPCHVFGLSIGCIVALELAGAHPDCVLSLTLCSPLPPVEPEAIVEGRMEVHRYWRQWDESTRENNPDLSDELVIDLMTGASQLLFNHVESSCIDAMCRFALKVAIRIWSGSAAKVREADKTGIEWFLHRQPVPEKVYQKIKGPVTVIHCSEDVAYPFECAEDLASSLQNAGVPQVSLHQTPAAHYGNVTEPDRINKFLYETVLTCHQDFPPWVPPHGDRVKLPTPFTYALMECGYDPDDDSD